MIWHHIKRKNTSIHNMVIYAIKNNYGFFFMKSEFFIDTLARRLIHYPYKVRVHWTMLMKQSTGAQRWKQVFRDITTRTKERLNWFDFWLFFDTLHDLLEFQCITIFLLATFDYLHFAALPTTILNLILIYIYRL